MEELRSPRVKFFGWLLLQERIQCRANLAKKNILDSDTRELCGQSAENCDHLVFHCPVANSFWTHLGLDSTSLPQVHRLWKMRRPDHIPQVLFSTMILLCCWQLWNHRHDVVFRQQQPSLSRLLATCKAACRLWSCRLRSQDKWVVDYWCDKFVSSSP